MHKEKNINESARDIQKKLDELIKRKEQQNEILKRFLSKDIHKKNNTH
ncbi:MAG: hypothetical protein L3J66_13370 [Bacteroidales bacterium]|nr:hypothetical protein [Bacteroidales bacterium]